jgi:CDP-diacylglycerol--glycerol-3-phosphate 3-phosphatidyltransferase
MGTGKTLLRTTRIVSFASARTASRANAPVHDDQVGEDAEFSLERPMKLEFNPPNIITASRIILTPAFVVLMVSEDAIAVQLSAAVFLVAALSDWYDGWYARRHNMMSAFGRFFDPLADKVLVGAAFFAFVSLDVLALWMVLITIGRDVMVTVLRFVADRHNAPVVTSRLAKWKTAGQLVFLWYLVAAYTMTRVEWVRALVPTAHLKALFAPWVIDGAMGLLTLASIITAVQYLYENRHLFRVLANGSVARTPS